MFSNKYPNITFFKVDIDELEDIKDHAYLNSIPTFYGIFIYFFNILSNKNMHSIFLNLF